MKVIINPKYNHLEESIRQIPDLFEGQGRVLYARRNLIKEMVLEDSLLINVKRYGIPGLINRIAYSFLGSQREKGLLYILRYCYRKGLKRLNRLLILNSEKADL